MRFTIVVTMTHLLHNAWQVPDIHHQVVVLRDLPSHLHNWRFLKGICANHPSWDLQYSRKLVRIPH